MKKTNLAIALLALLFMIACKKNEQTTRYELNTETSVAKWKGFLRTGYFNEGTIRVESENMEVVNGKVKSGIFQMPLSSLTNINLPAEQKMVLIHHLQSADFFNMAIHPNITFKFKSVKPFDGKNASAVAGANYTVSGLLSILGKPLPISFPARITLSGEKISVAAKLKVDRTKWGITFASDPALPDQDYIMPDMEIELDLRGVKK